MPRASRGSFGSFFVVLRVTISYNGTGFLVQASHSQWNFGTSVILLELVCILFQCKFGWETNGMTNFLFVTKCSTMISSDLAVLLCCLPQSLTFKAPSFAKVFATYNEHLGFSKAAHYSILLQLDSLFKLVVSMIVIATN